jgi:predicted  nucleic acid-binding Zn-ribbon protein
MNHPELLLCINCGAVFVDRVSALRSPICPACGVSHYEQAPDDDDVPHGPMKAYKVGTTTDVIRRKEMERIKQLVKDKFWDSME